MTLEAHLETETKIPTKNELCNELIQAYELLAEALPLALQHLKGGGLNSYEQWAFWVEVIDLDRMDCMAGTLTDALDRSGFDNDTKEVFTSRAEELREFQLQEVIDS